MPRPMSGDAAKYLNEELLGSSYEKLCREYAARHGGLLPPVSMDRLEVIQAVMDAAYPGSMNIS